MTDESIEKFEGGGLNFSLTYAQVFLVHRFVSDPINVLELCSLGSQRSYVWHPLVRISVSVHTDRPLISRFRNTTEKRFVKRYAKLFVSWLTRCVRNSSDRVSRFRTVRPLPSCSSSANETGHLPTAHRKNTADPRRGRSLVSVNEKFVSIASQMRCFCP